MSPSTLSKRRPDAVFAANVVRDVLAIANTGEVPTTSGCEAFEDGERLLGGAPKWRKELPEGLVDRVGSHPFATVAIEFFVRRRDGCTGQFQGCRAFHFAQRVQAVTSPSVAQLDLRAPANHGKWLYDGAGGQPERMITKVASAGGVLARTYGRGARAFAVLAAASMRRPARARSWGQGKWGPTNYLHLYYEPDSFDESLAPPSVGYKGSSRDHVYRSIGATDDDSELGKRHGFCFCDDCKEGHFNQCQLRNRFGSETRVRINAKVIAAAAITRANTTLEDLAKRPLFSDPLDTDLVSNVIALRVHRDDPNDENEAYYLGRVVGAAKVLETDGTYSGNVYVYTLLEYVY